MRRQLAWLTGQEKRTPISSALKRAESIDQHVACFGQLRIVVEGSGWVAGADGQRYEVATSDVTFFERGEQHAKGSDSGMMAIMVQIYDLVPSST